jgi:hypothetical protein
MKKLLILVSLISSVGISFAEVPLCPLEQDLVCDKLGNDCKCGSSFLPERLQPWNSCPTCL